MEQIYRFYAEKMPGFDVEAQSLGATLKTYLNIENLQNVRIFNRYDVAGLAEDKKDVAGNLIISEPQCDYLYEEKLPEIAGEHQIFAVESLPGQYDQRADSAAQCLQVVTDGVKPLVKTAKVYVLGGKISAEDLQKAKDYLINPVESREALLAKPESLIDKIGEPEETFAIEGFISGDEAFLSNLQKEQGLAMDLADLEFMQNYFVNEEKRNPTITELKMIDTYWSDHCRHTTFMTQIKDIDITDPLLMEEYANYLALREEVYGEEKAKARPITMMDMATIGAKALKKRGILNNLDESVEINACSVKVKAKTDHGAEDWLFMFKNETHNHPTEIEPFGGAATCLGGAIRDPLSGRAYVYQAMRVTGAADPRTPLEDTIPGKLPQRRITTLAAKGYSSYGNQIGLATGLVDEVYHPGYAAKRMEIGAVLGAAPVENVVRLVPEAGDLVVLLGGRTGRDGCGGATGSSKSHTAESLASCGAEVQKGNPVEERKIQRLFRNGEISKLIKRCNDFGAGGVSVAIGELADGLKINLNAVPKKYEGLNATELAISESQERMAVVIAAENVEKFIQAAAKENLEATVVAEVTAEKRLVMTYNDKIIVDLSREFLNSAGAVKTVKVELAGGIYGQEELTRDIAFEERYKAMAQDLNICSKRGLTEQFDSSIGAGTVVMPLGGKYQDTPIQTMSAKLPMLGAESETASLLSYGFDPYLSQSNQYLGAMCAVTESLAKLIAAGGTLEQAWLTFQEYFPNLRGEAKRWAMPVSALLGALRAQMDFGIAAIGGKDSMSGSFLDLDVPPTLVSFAAGITDAQRVISPEFKKPGHKVYLLAAPYDKFGRPNMTLIRQGFLHFTEAVKAGRIYAAWALGKGGIAEGVMKMAFGNRIGFKYADVLDERTIFARNYGGIIYESDEAIAGSLLLGETVVEESLSLGEKSVALADIYAKWSEPLEAVFPSKTKDSGNAPLISFEANKTFKSTQKTAKPKAVIPVFPGTNCEYDTARQVKAAGGEAEVVVIANLTAEMLEDSIKRLHEALAQAQMLILPGGFSFGDEPEGSGKFISAFLRHEQLKDDIHDLLYKRDGLALGICNGFQALIKLGLVPFGEIKEMDKHCPTLTFNNINRHQSRYVSTRIASNNSPWLMHTKVGEVHTVAISHGEGRFVCEEELLQKLIQNGQVATQYVDFTNMPSMDIDFNPNGSVYAVEGILSPDGRVLGKMGHSERIGRNVAKNIYGAKDQEIFKSGVEYFL